MLTNFRSEFMLYFKLQLEEKRKKPENNLTP